MSTEFDLIDEDFCELTSSILALLDGVAAMEVNPRTRIVSVQSSILLLGAAFEETIRQLAKAYARQVVSRAGTADELPERFPEAVWKRTLESMARSKIGKDGQFDGLSAAMTASRAVMENLMLFLEGDLTRDIYDNLIHNENNLRYGEINSLFKLSGLSKACALPSQHPDMGNFFNEEEHAKVDGNFMRALNVFIDLRNEVAHSLNSTSSVAPDIVKKDMAMLGVFVSCLSKSLAAV